MSARNRSKAAARYKGMDRRALDLVVSLTEENGRLKKSAVSLYQENEALRRRLGLTVVDRVEVAK